MIMRKRSAVFAAIVAVLIIGCATSKVARSPVDQAEANYVQIASDYQKARHDYAVSLSVLEATVGAPLRQ